MLGRVIDLDFGGKDYKIFGLDGRYGYFYIRKGDDNYSVSMAIFDYNPKLSL